MKLFAMSILLSFGTFGAFKSEDGPSLLVEYIKWTQTGEPELSKIIFDTEVDLTFQAGEDEFTSIPFYEYLSKVENPATSVPRSMTVTHFNLFENNATVHLSDHSRE